MSGLNGQRRPPRIDERHTYDIFQDQVRWMNRLKVDLQEIYEARVAINSVVKLALDIVREDYEANGERSHLVRVLVKGRPLVLEGGAKRTGR